MFAARSILLVLTLTLMVGFVSPAAAQGATPQSSTPFSKRSTADMLANIEGEHPAAYYVLAKRLFQEGKKDEAVFWFYTGQIRFRSRLMSHPNLPKDGEPAVFSSLSEVIGRPINEYAFGDIPKLITIIDRALAWDAAHASPFAPKGKVHDGVRAGLEKMKAEVLASAHEIRATRVKNGLENRNP
jgi:hypothetical protein